MHKSEKKCWLQYKKNFVQISLDKLILNIFMVWNICLRTHKILNGHKITLLTYHLHFYVIF